MSTYTIGEITVWLLLAAAIGFALGWLTRELTARRRPAAAVTPAQPTPAAAPAPAPAPQPAPVSIPPPEPDSAPAPVLPGPHPGSALPLADGAPPSRDYVVKVSRSSKIFHAPSSPAYARTTAAFWFTNAEAAEAAGFRPPKNG